MNYFGGGEESNIIRLKSEDIDYPIKIYKEPLELNNISNASYNKEQGIYEGNKISFIPRNRL